ncbi:Unknown protein [Striga hermonthica]|uniref:Uncharacterized protein n=1 Tax=Striga hermonthica TaxID=68872 RepID=A0A9N7NMV0_STRHE|nr:Unknown protein [Striga hermonthica]
MFCPQPLHLTLVLKEKKGSSFCPTLSLSEKHKSLSLIPNQQLMELTPQQMKNYDGNYPSRLNYVAVRDWMYDVTIRALAKLGKDESDVVR